MLVPNKYEDVSKNILSLGLDVLRVLKLRKNVYDLYQSLLRERNDTYQISFNKFLLTLDFLYSLDLITLKDGDVIRK